MKKENARHIKRRTQDIKKENARHKKGERKT